jgi:hypothetical protein
MIIYSTVITKPVEMVMLQLFSTFDLGQLEMFSPFLWREVVEILRQYCIDCMNFINLSHFLFLYMRDIYTKISNGNFLVYILISNGILCYSTITYFIIYYYYS